MTFRSIFLSRLAEKIWSRAVFLLHHRSAPKKSGSEQSYFWWWSLWLHHRSAPKKSGSTPRSVDLVEDLTVKSILVELEEITYHCHSLHNIPLCSFSFPRRFFFPSCRTSTVRSSTMNSRPVVPTLPLPKPATPAPRRAPPLPPPRAAAPSREPWPATVARPVLDAEPGRGRVVAPRLSTPARPCPTTGKAARASAMPCPPVREAVPPTCAKPHPP